ncbi:centromere kinetochore protein [Grosmannia clavigera kw1407]|uniref:Centromere kinetochore protein n=1 Tax=Grosmannia clavigera (strain kw1407 / UAMH 11150) TaxID=655863 RepID=F0XRE2_GROCL|nr:centromere kinetochore protein [Grosmannia clavigera kw1407]EFX00019.1 centromere kinetochore protein [Grosmannia clavigera kw1407]
MAVPSDVVGQALVGFSLNGLFPEDDVSSIALTPERLPAAIQVLTEAKAKLEGEIHEIVQETADDLRSWVTNAKALQVDIARRKLLAGDILIRADAPKTDEQAIEEAEARALFLTNELNYNLQVRYLLEAIRSVNQLLDQVEQAAEERRILDALHLLEKSWTALDAMPVSKTCRAMRLLDLRAFELKSDVHKVFDHVWGALVHVDAENGTLTVLETRQDEPMSLSNAVIGLMAYKEVDGRMTQLWHELDKAVVAPRTDLSTSSRPGIYVDDVALGIRGQAGEGIEALFTDLDQIFAFLALRLPSDLVQSISSVMMPELVSRIVDVWLASAVPTSLDKMAAFEDTIRAAEAFCSRLAKLQYSGFGRLQEWIENAPRVWLSKRRETALDSVRKKIAGGLGTPHEVERVEKQMVSRSEGKELAANGPSTATDQAADWDAAWTDDEEETQDSEPKTQAGSSADDGADAWGAWGDDDEAVEAPEADAAPELETETHDDEDDAADAWGWGEEDTNVEETEVQQQPAVAEQMSAATTAATEPTTRELIMKEKYHITAMPEPVLAMITSILEDGAVLLSEGPVATAAAGLFSLPTMALAMFRAVSPFYYALDVGGSMYLYNDAMYLAEKLGELATAWKMRPDLDGRAQAMLRLDGEVAKLQAFASRAYGRELAIQKTVLRDLLGGDQNAVAALVEAVAAKLIADVLDMTAISQDEAFSLASLMARVTELDDLFGGEPTSTPLTAQYVPSWLRMQYLSEVLQSNLPEVRYLWMDSELSLYFSADEVVDLVRLSFEDNAKAREVVREIAQNPHPVEV